MTDTLIRAIHGITESGPVIRCAPDVDLDALLLEALAHPDMTNYPRMHDGILYEEPLGWGPSRLADPGGATVGWFRIDPCGANCGEHGWHLRPLGDERPEGRLGRGAWFGVWFE